jgi:hypothetical protein
MHVIDFLRKFQANSLLTNVSLDLSQGKTQYALSAMQHILPLISSICSIHFRDLFNWVYDCWYNTKETQLLLKRMLTQTRILQIEW